MNLATNWRMCLPTWLLASLSMFGCGWLDQALMAVEPVPMRPWPVFAGAGRLAVSRAERPHAALLFLRLIRDF